MTHLTHRLGISWPVLKASLSCLRSLRVRQIRQFFVIFERADPYFVYFKWPGVFRSKDEAFLEVGKYLQIVYEAGHPAV
jgi:hypothetical protein